MKKKMDHAQALGKLLDKVKPLQEAKRNTQADLIKELEKKPTTERAIEHNGRVYKLKYTASKPTMNKKFIDEVIKLYNAEKNKAIPDEFMQFLLDTQERRKKEPIPRLSITKT